MFEKEQIRELNAIKIIVYTVLSFLLAALQSTVGNRMGIFGTTPQLTLALVSSAAYFYGSATGAVTGLFAGLFTDILGGAGISMLPLFYTLLGFFLGAYTYDKRQARTDSLGGFAIALAVGCGVGMVICVISLLINAGKPNLFLTLWRIALPEALCTYFWGWLFALTKLVKKAEK